MTTNNTVTLCSVRAADDGAQLHLHVEIKGDDGVKKELLSVLTSRISHLPHIGALSEQELLFYRREDAVCRAIQIGLRALAASGTSRAQLTQKLRRRGVSAAVATEAVAALAARGYVDEAAGALREMERGLAKLWGDRRILADIRAKGYGEAEVAAVCEELHAEDAVSRCAALIRRRHMALPQDAASLSRFVASLMRYGYSTAQIKAAMKQNKHETV